MKAMVLAAGLGTRLRPWTLKHPKALVPVGGVPMLERVIVNLRERGFDYIVVNVHHFAGQVKEFIRSRDFGVEIEISDESERLLDTGGAILKAAPLLRLNDGPVLVHNVDILSDADLSALMRAHEGNGSDSTLLVSDRVSSRRLVFGSEMLLKGWHNTADDRYKPAGFRGSEDDEELAFSGIHVVGERLLEAMRRIESDERFPLVDFLLNAKDMCIIKGLRQDGMRLIDIGKPATLSQADDFWR